MTSGAASVPCLWALMDGAFQDLRMDCLLCSSSGGIPAGGTSDDTARIDGVVHLRRRTGLPGPGRRGAVRDSVRDLGGWLGGETVV